MIASDGQEYGYFLSEQVWLKVQAGIIQLTIDWLRECQKQGNTFHLAAITRHVLGFAHGLGGSRYWRQQLSDYRLMGEVKTEVAIRHFYETASSKLRIFSESYEDQFDDPIGG